MKVAICVVTYRRLESLDRLLLSLRNLTFEKVPQPELSLVVVDNDPQRSAFEVVERARSQMPWPVVYRNEPRPGIPAARNTAIDECAEADAIAFIDDDESATTGWLDELLLVGIAHTAEIVVGPVIPIFQPSVPKWIREGGFFERPRAQTGSKLALAGTNNILLRQSLLKRLSPTFSDDFPSGSDTHFSLRLSKYRIPIYWADDALVMEYVPEERATLKWILRRAYRGGNSYVRAERQVVGSGSAPSRLAKAMFRIVGGLGLALLGTVSIRRVTVVKGLQSLALGAGMWAGLFGVAFNEYKRPNDSVGPGSGPE
jgi:glycosyltransferase involved in cell wall biosynthesis